MNSKKKLCIYPYNYRVHSLYDDLFKELGKDYDLIYNPPTKQNKNLKILRILKNPHLLYVYHKFIRRFISFDNIKKIFKVYKMKN